MLTRRHFLLGSLLYPMTSGLVFAGLPTLTARHAYVGNLNDTLLAIDADKPVQIASITKLITAWVILTADLPRLIIGSMVKNMPGFSTGPVPAVAALQATAALVVQRVVLAVL